MQTQDRHRDRHRDRERNRDRDRDRRHRSRDRSELRKRRSGSGGGDRDRDAGRAVDKRIEDVRSGKSEKRRKDERMAESEETTVQCEETRITRISGSVDPGNEKIPECINQRLTIGSSLLTAASTSSCSPATRDMPGDKRQAQEQKRKQLWNTDKEAVSFFALFCN